MKRLGDLGWHAEEGIPFLSMRVLNGVPGLTVEHTGAPIVNDDGDLIGIAGGVIKGRSWAVSADGDWHPVTPEDLQRLAEPELWQLTAFFWN